MLYKKDVSHCQVDGKGDTLDKKKATTGPGRPRTITRERLADAGIAMGLPQATLVGIAAHIGVSPKALYKHFSGFEELKQLIAEEIFLRWSLPALPKSDGEGLESYMTKFSDSMWELVKNHTGIAPYMLREDMITPAMMEKMKTHQEDLARVFDITFAQSHWLVFTVAYHCVAVADTVLPLKGTTEAPSAASDTSCQGGIIDAYELRVRSLYGLGSRALIVGALAILDQITVADF